MSFDFDRVIDRRGTNSMAHDGYADYLFDGDAPPLPVPHDELLRLWVADMQFATAPCVIEGIQRRLEHPVLGYTSDLDDQFFNAFNGWTNGHYGWEAKRSDFFTYLGVVPTLYALVDCFCTNPGDKAMTLVPSYGMFDKATAHHAVELVGVPLVRSKGWAIDFDQFEAAAADPAMRLFFLCHPHNPTGRIWAPDELARMAEICFRHDVVLVSDEIHCDLRRIGVEHTSTTTVVNGEGPVITCMSPSKTFNTAGLMTSAIVIDDPAMQERWKDRTKVIVSALGLAGSTAAYEHGAEWYDAMRRYVDENFEVVRNVMAEHLPKAGFTPPAATYLAWLDLSAYLGPERNLSRHFLEHAGLLVEGGDMFVDHAASCVRVNVACPRSVLADAMERLVNATLGD